MLNYPVEAERLYSLPSEKLEDTALMLFQYQYNNNKTYRQYVDTLGISPAKVTRLTDIPFLPVSFFKSHEVITSDSPVERVFYSSGTTGAISSKHLVADLSLYDRILLEGFRQSYGNPAEWTFLCLLPSYLEREGSSLVYMAEKLIEASANEYSGFYLYDYEKLALQLKKLAEMGKKTLLLGVTFALLDFAEQFPMSLHQVTIMETGGMKGRREELIREEVHGRLKKAFGVVSIHSEYGMTEMLSQAYSKGEGIFHCPPWVKVLVGDLYDPLDVRETGKGKLKIIDMANMFSCPFIATDDIGEVFPDSSFTVSGRSDGSEIRGCNLMVSSL